MNFSSKLKVTFIFLLFIHIGFGANIEGFASRDKVDVIELRALYSSFVSISFPFLMKVKLQNSIAHEKY